MSDLVELFIPLGVCVILPIGIVWIIFASIMNRDNKNAEIMIKALENNSPLDAETLMKSLAKKDKTSSSLWQLRLLRGCIFTLIGIATAAFAIVMASCMPEENVQYPFLLISLLSFAIGVSYIIVYFVTRKEDKKHL